MNPNFPFTDAIDEQIRSLGEDALVERIREVLGDRSPPAPEGIGDDCAAVPVNPQDDRILLTIDSLTWGIHFDVTASAAEAGAKLLKRNLSDIAAMAGRPRCALLNLQCGPDLRIEWLLGFVRGLADCARAWKVMVVGGDVSGLAPETFSASVALVGGSVVPLTRSTARVGDRVWVTGTLGGSLAGHHLHFTPRLKEAVFLAQHAIPTSMMDISDGIGTDLPRLIPEGTAVRLDAEALPLSPVTGTEPIPIRRQRALFDGEDYELLFTTASAAGTDWVENFRRAFPQTPVTLIGIVIERPDGSPALIWKDGDPVTGSSFAHFNPLNHDRGNDC